MGTPPKCALFLVSLLAIALLRGYRRAGRDKAIRAGSFIEEFKEGLRFFVSHSVLKTLLISSVIVMLGAGALNALSIFFITNNLNTAPELFGLVGTTFGVGTLAGAILASLYVPRVGLARAFWVATLAVGVLVLIFSRMTSFAPALVVLFLLGVAIPALQVAIGPLMLEVTPRQLVGRIVAVMNPTTSVAELASMLIAGTLASTLLREFRANVLGVSFGPYDTIFAATGILTIAGGLYAAAMLWDYRSAPTHPPMV